LSYHPRLAGFYADIVAGFATDIDNCFVKIKSISRVKITALRRRAFPSISEIPQGDPLNIGLVQIQRGEPLI